ncbi:MAG: hypothetical protein ACKV2T_02680 [Kofleriaceae bacterium]
MSPAAAELEKTTGTLVVKSELESATLSSHWTVEVRDAGFREVARFEGSETLELSPGVYSVTALREDGTTDSRTVVVSLDKNENPPVVFTSPPIQRDLLSVPSPIAARNLVTLDELVDQMDRLARDWTGDHAVVDDIFLFASPAGLRCDATVEGQVGVQVDGDIGSTPWLAFARGNEVACVALPIGGTREADRTCGLVVSARHVDGQTIAIDVDWSVRTPELHALVNIVERGNVGEALSLAGHVFAASDDPITSAYAALALLRFGGAIDPDRLGDLHDAAPWLLDLQILRGTVLIAGDDDVERSRGIGLLLEASTRAWPLWSDAYSLLLTTLRRLARSTSDQSATARSRLDAIHARAMRLDLGSPVTMLRWR